MRISNYPKFQAFDNNGNPLKGGKLYTYKEGTTTAKATYTTVAGSTPNANPIVLDTRGEATIFGTGSYKYVLKTSAGVTLWTVDGIRGADYNNLAYADDDLEAAITAAGATETTILIDQPVLLTGNLTVPSNVGLWIEKNGVITIPDTYKITINGPFDCGPWKCFTDQNTDYDGVVFNPSAVKEVHAEWWTTNTSPGTTDMTAAISCATNSSGGRTPVRFLDTKYLVSNQLTITPEKYSWIGAVPSRGCNGYGANNSYPSTIISYENASTSEYMVSKNKITGATVFGPFAHENITFLSTTCKNFFEFGKEDLNGDGTSVTVDGDGQSVPMHPSWKECAFHLPLNRPVCSGAGLYTTPFSYNTTGNLTPTCGIAIWLTKAFEPTIENCSFFGGDIHVRTWGCDKPLLSKVRMQYAWISIDFNSIDSYAVQHTLENVQIEVWGILPVKSWGVNLAVSDCRFESGAEQGTGKLTLTETAAVTEYSDTLTFTATMANKLFPGISVISISNGTLTENLLVKSVSGATVTVYANAAIASDTYSTTIPWTAAAATVIRYHGCGPLHYSDYDAAYSNISIYSVTDCPSFVYVVGRGDMLLTNCNAQAGTIGDVSSMVIGNRSSNYPTYPNSQMAFANCTALIEAPLSNPFATSTNRSSNYGGKQSAQRQPFNDLADLFGASKKWALTPKNTVSYDNYSNRNPMVIVAGDTYSTQKFAAWIIKDAGYDLLLYENTLPSTGYVRISVKAKAITSGAKLRFYYIGNGAAATADYATLSTSEWTTYVYEGAIPAVWTGGARANCGLVFTNNAAEEYYLAGVLVEEIQAFQTMPVLAAAPAFPVAGQFACANRTAWDPASIGSGGPYMVWYNGSAWVRIDAQ